MIDDSDSLDELASAHLDGETTVDEQGRIAGDESLRARLASLRLVAQALSDDLPRAGSAVREAHLETALAAFDELDLTRAGGAGTPGPTEAGSTLPAGGDLVDLGRRRRANGPARGTGRSGLPLWLGAAAATIVTIGALGWVITTIGAGEEDSDTAAVSPDAEFEFETATDESAGDSVSSDGALMDDGSLPAGAPESAGDVADLDDASSYRAESGDEADTQGGVEPEEFTAVPSDDELSDAVERSLLSAEDSECGASLESPPGTALTGVVPVIVSGIAGEALVFESSDGIRTFILVTEGCTPFEE